MNSSTQPLKSMRLLLFFFFFCKITFVLVKMYKMITDVAAIDLISKRQDSQLLPQINIQETKKKSKTIKHVDQMECEMIGKKEEINSYSYWSINCNICESYKIQFSDNTPLNDLKMIKPLFV